VSILPLISGSREKLAGLEENVMVYFNLQCIMLIIALSNSNIQFLLFLKSVHLSRESSSTIIKRYFCSEIFLKINKFPKFGVHDYRYPQMPLSPYGTLPDMLILKYPFKSEQSNSLHGKTVNVKTFPCYRIAEI
jgi:hypothetical protein